MDDLVDPTEELFAIDLQIDIRKNDLFFGVILLRAAALENTARLFDQNGGIFNHKCHLVG
jgi:hypothetical protein